MQAKENSLPLFIPSEQLSPFVETNTTLSKSDLVARMAGRVKNEWLQLIRLLQFSQITKDERRELSLL